jgi:DNA polymerase-3 subunit epsilon
MGDEIRKLNAEALELYATALDADPNYLVLRRLDPDHWDFAEVPPPDAKHGLYVDVETTGLNPAEDDVIELGMVAFQFDREGMIHHASLAYQGFQESRKLSAEIIELTGITPQMIAGQQIDLAKVAEILERTDLVVSHKADFDRKFAERLCDGFRTKAWGCSMESVPWQAEGIEGGRRLKYLAQEFGFFYDAHRATDDCWAGVEVLSRTLPKSGRTALAHLLDAARKPTWRIWAQNAPFKDNDRLKARGYRWSAEEPGLLAKCWYLDLQDETLRDEEIGWLRGAIYPGATSFDPRIDRITAYDRFAVRDWK